MYIAPTVTPLTTASFAHGSMFLTSSLLHSREVQSLRGLRRGGTLPQVCAEEAQYTFVLRPVYFLHLCALARSVCDLRVDALGACLACTCLPRRYRVVPSAYRKAMPVSLKSHRR